MQVKLESYLTSFRPVSAKIRAVPFVAFPADSIFLKSGLIYPPLAACGLSREFPARF